MDQLDEDCKAWLDKFAKEYIGASFKHKDPLHKTKEEQRELYTRNNERNRCVLSRQKAYGHLNYIEDSPMEKKVIEPDLSWMDEEENED